MKSEIVYQASEFQNPDVGKLCRLVAAGQNDEAMALAETLVEEGARYDYGDAYQEEEIEIGKSDLFIVGRWVVGHGPYTLALFGAMTEGYLIVARG